MIPEKNDINIYIDKARLRAPAFLIFSIQMLLQRLDNIHDKDTFLFCQFMQCLAQFICVFTRIFTDTTHQAFYDRGRYSTFCLPDYPGEMLRTSAMALPVVGLFLLFIYSDMRGLMPRHAAQICQLHIFSNSNSFKFSLNPMFIPPERY